jgi:hypothetical protein
MKLSSWEKPWSISWCGARTWASAASSPAWTLTTSAALFITELLAVADEITKTLAICMQCGNPAKHTQRLIASEDLIVVGAEGMYEARCRRCFEPDLAAAEVQQKKKTELVTSIAAH